jgi:hypothetical protein
VKFVRKEELGQPMAAWFSRRRSLAWVASLSFGCSSFSFLLSLFHIFLFPLSPSLLWQPNRRTLKSLSPNSSRHPKSLPQSVPFLPDLPPSLGQKIRKFNQLHFRSQSRPLSHHRPNPTITLERPPNPPLLLPRLPPPTPLQAPVQMVPLNPTPQRQVPVGTHNKPLSRRLHKAQVTRPQLSQ